MATPYYDVFPYLASVAFDRPNVHEGEIEQARRAAKVATSFAGGPFCTRFFEELGVPARAGFDEEVVEGLLECVARGDVSNAGWGMAHGVYRHFKHGHLYRTLSVGRCADTGEPRVGYLSLVDGREHSRRASQWNEVVQWPDGKYRSRFLFVSSQSD